MAGQVRRRLAAERAETRREIEEVHGVGYQSSMVVKPVWSPTSLGQIRQRVAHPLARLLAMRPVKVTGW